MLGYLNFSGGKADSRFQKQVSDSYGAIAEAGEDEPWKVLPAMLLDQLDILQQAEAGPFQEADQARTILSSLFPETLTAYRQHHADLLFHRRDSDIFVPFFLARVFESILLQKLPWSEGERIVVGAVHQLNDFIGHRPIAILENRPQGEPYDHERIRPLPLYLRGAGVAWGRYRELVAQALAILEATDPALLEEAFLDMKLLDEIAVDPRAYDQGHPVNRRPNYVFGEWDPHHLDNQGRYRRLVVRDVLIEALQNQVDNAQGVSRSEALIEAGAVLAGTMLMATGISGSHPGAHDSTMTLARRMPPIARYRDRFYQELLGKIAGPHAERLRQEAQVSRQPFGLARQQLNEFLARHRSGQLQQRHLALLYATMGYPDASRRESERIQAPSIRLLGEIVLRLESARRLAEWNALDQAGALLPEIEDWLHRGIGCGALADPWNILGFQALFPLAQAQEDSVRDTRIDDLIGIMQQLFILYARLMSDGAAQGDQKLVARLQAPLKHLAAWWDQFASIEVQEVPRVHGAEAVHSAEQVSRAILEWHERGRSGDLGFWKQHIAGFRSPKAYALVLEALLRHKEYRPALGLLVSWLGQAEQVPLEDGIHSFHVLALRWMLELTQSNAPTTPPPEGNSLATKFLDYLESNAEEYWEVPVLTVAAASSDREEVDDLYGAAYEGVTYRDSTDNDQQGSVVDGAAGGDFDLEAEWQPLSGRLRFLSTVARLWQIAGRGLIESCRQTDQEQARSILQSWLATAQANRRGLLSLMKEIHAYPIPTPTHAYESLLEYDRRRGLKEHLLEIVIATAFDTSMAVGSLRGGLESQAEVGSEKGTGTDPPDRSQSPFLGPRWEASAIRIELALSQGDAAAIQAVLPSLIGSFKDEPLVFQPTSAGGTPRQILRVRIAQAILNALARQLPRLGLLRETFDLLTTARAMEQNQRTPGQNITEFNVLFQTGFRAVVENVVEASLSWQAPYPAGELAELLEFIANPFMALWLEHCQDLQLSILESIRGDQEWSQLQDFLRRYGGDLFHSRFMTLANLRSVLHRGVAVYLEALEANADPLHPVALLNDLDKTISRADAIHFLEIVIHTVIENYSEYKDYNTSTTQSDYGENMYLLIDFLRLKVSYERMAWRLRPMMLVHEVLARKGFEEVRRIWQAALTNSVQSVNDVHLKELARLQKTYGIQLLTVGDRLAERFVRPLEIDRLCALVEPAMAESKEQHEDRAFAELERQVSAQTAEPAGAGLDLPPWLQRLEQEVRRVQLADTDLAAAAEQWGQGPKRFLSAAEMQNQFKDWQEADPTDKPS
jgi:hypothetical protein